MAARRLAPIGHYLAPKPSPPVTEESTDQATNKGEYEKGLGVGREDATGLNGARRALGCVLIIFIIFIFWFAYFILFFVFSHSL